MTTIYNLTNLLYWGYK